MISWALCELIVRAYCRRMISSAEFELIAGRLPSL